MRFPTGVPNSSTSAESALVRARQDVNPRPPRDRHGRRQRLYQWVPGRADAVFVSDERLVAFTAGVEGLQSDANRLRDVLRELQD